jgi:hypothetical protein
MHRSGTSLVASALAAGGIAMGERLLPGDRHNRPGYFEDLDVLDLDRRLLAAACPPGDPGHADWGWTESERLDVPAVVEAHRGDARALVEARAAAGRPWGFKDPRAALLLDFWLSMAPDARFVLPYRLPWEVADSLQRLGADVFLRHPDYGYRIWTFYNRHLLDFRRRHPERTVLVSVDAAVADPGRFAEALRTLGLELPADALARRLEPELFHRLAAGDPLIALAGAVHPACVELLAALDAEASLPAAGLWHAAAPRAPRRQAEPRVTVVVPCHDDGELLIEAVASVERSIDEAYELIVVDDGSRQPRTVAVLDLLAAAGYDVHRLPHGGLAAARNHGFAAARAPFVVPLDADNRLLPGFVGPALAVLAGEPSLGAVYGDRVDFGGRNGRVEVGPFDVHRLAGGNYVDACAVLRRQAWQECGGYDGAMPLQGWEDWELWLAMVERGWVLRWLPEPGFEYRVRPDSMIHALVGSPHFSSVRAYMVGKHAKLYVESLGSAADALRAAERERERYGSRVEEAAAALAARSAELEQARAGLLDLAARLEEARQARAALESDSLRLAGEARDLAADRDLLDRQRAALHGHLARWRERWVEAESSRALRLRRSLVRLRSRLEGRPQTGPAFPCVIGATGGSGTRVFARLAAQGGLAIGAERNEFEDALPIEHFLDRWLAEFWRQGGAEPPHAAPPGMDEAFAAAFGRHLAGEAAAGPRGWKSPRSLYVLPFLAQRLPDLRFLQVVRDGRDMALSANQLQLARYGELLLSAAERQRPEAERSIILWNRVNLWAADAGERLGAAYLRIRFEDLCARPAAVTKEVFRFFDLPGDPRRAARLVAPPESLGRWRRADPELAARLEEAGGPALRRFGYLSA